MFSGNLGYPRNWLCGCSEYMKFIAPAAEEIERGQKGYCIVNAEPIFSRQCFAGQRAISFRRLDYPIPVRVATGRRAKESGVYDKRARIASRGRECQGYTDKGWEICAVRIRG